MKYTDQKLMLLKKHTLCPGALTTPVNAPEAANSPTNGILMFLVSPHSHHPSIHTDSQV